MTSRGPRPNPPAPSSDLDACEATLGVALPTWLRERLATENGWDVDDDGGPTGETWRFLPVLDRSDRKARTRTAEDVVWHTRTLREQAAAAGLDFFEGVVVVARAYAATTRLVLLPDDENPAVLLPALWRQERLEPIRPTPVELPGVDSTPPAKASAEGSAALKDRSELPVFRYHPDPVATGAVLADADAECEVCEQVTGWVYARWPYGEDPQPEELCPWCIADGSAAERFGSEFLADIEGEVPQAVEEELRRRTPSFEGWQEERWLTHCGDAAAFVGRAGWAEIKDRPAVIAELEAQGWPAEDLRHLDADGDARAYLFLCLECGAELAYTDAS